jgi:hypothetical protein
MRNTETTINIRISHKDKLFLKLWLSNLGGTAKKLLMREAKRKSEGK